MSPSKMSIVCGVLTLLALPAGAAERPPSGDPVARAVAAWQAAFAAHSDCIGTVTVRFEQLDGRRGEYRTAEAVVGIDLDVDADDRPLVAVHELAHHAFVECAVHEDAAFTAAFYRAQGLPSDRAWFDYSSGWEDTPAELFAEAVVVVVLGEQPAHLVDLTPEAVEVAAAWMRDGSPDPLTGS